MEHMSAAIHPQVPVPPSHPIPNPIVLLYVCPPPLELETDWPIKPYCPSNPSLSSPVHRQLTSLGVSSTLASATGLSTFSADIFAGVTSGVEGRYVDATYYCDSNRLAGEDFPDAKKKHPSTVGGRSLRPCAGTWQQREEIRKPHQAVTTKAHHLQKQSNPRCAGEWAPLRLSPPPPPPVSLTTSNNGRSGAAKQQPSPKNLPLFAVARRRSSHPRLFMQKQERTWGDARKWCVTYRILVTEEEEEEKKRAWPSLLLRVEVGRSESDGGEV